MEQPFHSVRSIPQKAFTPARAAGLAAALVLQAGFFYAIVSGLAATLVQRYLQLLVQKADARHSAASR